MTFNGNDSLYDKIVKIENVYSGFLAGKYDALHKSIEEKTKKSLTGCSLRELIAIAKENDVDGVGQVWSDIHSEISKLYAEFRGDYDKFIPCDVPGCGYAKERLFEQYSSNPLVVSNLNGSSFAVKSMLEDVLAENDSLSKRYGFRIVNKEHNEKVESLLPLIGSEVDVCRSDGKFLDNFVSSSVVSLPVYFAGSYLIAKGANMLFGFDDPSFEVGFASFGSVFGSLLFGISMQRQSRLGNVRDVLLERAEYVDGFCSNVKKSSQ